MKLFHDKGGPQAVAALGLALATCMTPAVAMQDLLAVYDLALRNDPTYLAAVDANLAAREATPQARAALLPNITASASAGAGESTFRTRNRSAAPDTRSKREGRRLSLQLSIRQPIYRQDLWTALEQAGLAVQEADLTLASEQQALMLRSSESYFEVLRARAAVRSARAAREAFGQQLEQARQRFEVGLIATTDVEEAQAGFDRARADEIQATTNLDIAYEALREVTGTYLDMLADLTESFELTPPAPDDIDAWTRKALDANLELGAARLRAEQAEQQIDIEFSGHLPSVDLVGTHSESSDNSSRAGGTGSGVNTASSDSFIGFEVNLPIYAGGRVKSRTRQARALYSQRLDDIERARRIAQRETRSSYLGVKSGISRVEALIQAVRSARSAREAVTAGFEVGTRTSLDVLNADRDVFQAEFDLAAARYDYILDVLRLKRAAGTLAADDLATTNDWLQP